MDLLEFSGLEEELESVDGKTLLVPTDSAFDKLDDETASKLKEDKEFAQKVCFPQTLGISPNENI